MEHYFICGFFSLYLASVALARFLVHGESRDLNSMKKDWGRIRGAVLHFVSYVAVPLSLGILFLGHGISVFDTFRSLSLPSGHIHRQLLEGLAYCSPHFEIKVYPSEVSASGEIALFLSLSSEN